MDLLPIGVMGMTGVVHFEMIPTMIGRIVPVIISIPALIKKVTTFVTLNPTAMSHMKESVLIHRGIGMTGWTVPLHEDRIDMNRENMINHLEQDQDDGNRCGKADLSDRVPTTLDIDLIDPLGPKTPIVT